MTNRAKSQKLAIGLRSRESPRCRGPWRFSLPAMSKRCWRESFPNVYLIYSGGDDLVAVGPWNEMFDLALRIRNEFGRFTAGNAAFTLSAGIAVTHYHLPVLSAIEEADRCWKRQRPYPETVSCRGRCLPQPTARHKKIASRCLARRCRGVPLKPCSFAQNGSGLGSGRHAVDRQLRRPADVCRDGTGVRPDSRHTPPAVHPVPGAGPAANLGGEYPGATASSPLGRWVGHAGFSRHEKRAFHLPVRPVRESTLGGGGLIMEKGRIARFDPERNFGFIAPDRAASTCSFTRTKSETRGTQSNRAPGRV